MEDDEDLSNDVNKEDVLEVFNFWKEHMGYPHGDLDLDRIKKIKWALRKYSITLCKEAIMGCRLTPYNMGKNHMGETYNTIRVIFSCSDNIERFIYNYNNPPKIKELYFTVEEHTDNVLRHIQQNQKLIQSLQHAVNQDVDNLISLLKDNFNIDSKDDQ